jgi:hypothetical protein
LKRTSFGVDRKIIVRVLNKMGECMSENNIKMDFMKITWESMGWIHLLQDRNNWAVLNMVMKFHLP